MSLHIASPTTRNRIQSIDTLRGLVMVIMALDHTRDFFSGFPYNPADLNHTTVSMFLVRWITHFCAPIFIFLIGVGMAIARERGKSKVEISLFLLTRGIWMIFIELTVVSFGWTFDLSLTSPICQVIWVTGWAMIVLAGLIFLPKTLIFIFGIVLAAGHNLLDGKDQLLLGPWVWLHAPTANVHLPGIPYIHFFIFYPLIPWIGVSALGYVFGSLFFLSPKKRTQWLVGIGLACIILFLLIRAINIYGDPSPWLHQKSWGFTLLSFVNCTKYPPSLSYLLMTLGPGILLMAWFEHSDNALTRFFTVYGRVPFFYYILHIYFIHILAIIISYAYFGHIEWLIGPLSLARVLMKPVTHPGYSLPILLLVWATVVAVFYPLCRWYGNFKAQHKNNVWLSYL